MGMAYLLFLKKRQNLKLSSAASYRWCFIIKYVALLTYIANINMAPDQGSSLIKAHIFASMKKSSLECT